MSAPPSDSARLRNGKNKKEEAEVLSREDLFMIQEERAKGVYIKDIAEKLDVSERTVRRALKQGGAPSGKRAPRVSKLDGYRQPIDDLLQEGVWNARVILRELQAQGFTGSYTVLTDYIRPKRALRAQRKTVRYETRPGQQLQHDWGELFTDIGGVEQKVFFNLNTLGYSRRFHAWAAPCQDAHHTYEGLVRSFEYFGGSPREVLVDNQKAAVIEHRIGHSVKYHARFLDLAHHYGFTPKACRPYRARTKGKVERMVHYLKENFFVRYRRFDSFAHLNQQLEHWLREEADQRVHGTHGEIVGERFLRDELAQLQPLPVTRFDTSYFEFRYAHWDGYVDVRGNRYSVPSQCAGQQVSIRVGLDDQLRVYDREGQCIAHHRLVGAQAGWQTVAEHHQQLWQQTLQVERRPLAVYEEVAQWN
jgi:transposase